MKNKSYSVDEIRKAHSNAYAPWTLEEDEVLKKSYGSFLLTKESLQTETKFIAEMANLLQRNPGAIRSRIAKYLDGKPIVYQEKKDVQQKLSSNVHNKQPVQPLATPTSQASVVDINPQFQKAYEFMESSSKNLFITGRAGTGKSTLLSYFRSNTKKKVVVLAPTGVAALNVKGQTIHSFFKFKPDITVQNVKRLYKKDEEKNLYTKIDTIVIDEISMVRSDILDCIDKFLRLNRFSDQPFGGVQMIFIGDLYQLPPVVSSSEREIFQTHYKSQYFFDAYVFQGFPLEFIELEKVYRQKDDTFIQLLNAVRNNTATDEHLAQVNKRYHPDYVPRTENLTIYLTTTNDLADAINAVQLDRLKGKLYQYAGYLTGSFEKKSLPTDVELSVKIGSQVMMLNNDMQGRWVNGSIGKIVGIEKDDDGIDIIFVELANGTVEEIYPYTWELFNFTFDKETNNLSSHTVGTFTQYPMRLAWAVTIHKSQGKTFDHVIIDIGRGTFAHGQLYVALSRCTSLQGIVLKQPIQKRHILMDYRVVKFVTQFQYKKSDEILPLQKKIEVLKKAIENKQKVSITYLKANDEKSRRIILPLRVQEKNYMGREFLGVDAFDEKKGEERVFRIDRILELHTS